MKLKSKPLSQNHRGTPGRYGDPPRPPRPRLKWHEVRKIKARLRKGQSVPYIAAKQSRSESSVKRVKEATWGTGVMGRPPNTVFQNEAALQRRNQRDNAARSARSARASALAIEAE